MGEDVRREDRGVYFKRLLPHAHPDWYQMQIPAKPPPTTTRTETATLRRGKPSLCPRSTPRRGKNFDPGYKAGAGGKEGNANVMWEGGTGRK
jgi:hypothetical protein